jgi:hypothetical protein
MVLAWAVGLGVLALEGDAAAQQSLGARIPGTLGLYAGVQADPGVYVQDKFLLYGANEVVDGMGRPLSLRPDIDGWANGVGVGGTLFLPRLHTYVGAGVGIAFAHVSVQTGTPDTSQLRQGFGDVYVQPLHLGWRARRFDIVTGYALYVPTGRFQLTGTRVGVSRGSFTHELSLGGTAYLDRDRKWRVSALASLALNQREIGLDLTRGDTVIVQGGAGRRLFRMVDVGLVGYGLWQINDDQGADLPPALRGIRDQAVGMGVEVDVLIPALKSQLTLRCAEDLADKARPVGAIAYVGWTLRVWKPQSPPRSVPAEPRERDRRTRHSSTSIGRCHRDGSLQAGKAATRLTYSAGRPPLTSRPANRPDDTEVSDLTRLPWLQLRASAVE